MGLFNFLTHEIAMDLGTANTLIIHNDEIVSVRFQFQRNVLSEKAGVDFVIQRGDLFEKRARLMEAWADFTANAPASGNVVVALRA